MTRIPFLDRSECTDCEACIDLCPGVFRKNRDTGCIDVADLPDYPEDAIQEAMAFCPGHCIAWEES